jgi:quinol-cytochrome oxidoreductase complex cytochrome b subunit/mono/diheme cytochrome c family protein
MSILTWLDDRTGYKGFVNAALYEHVPGGARWRYVWGSTLVFAFAVQMITGLFLWMHYSPSAQTAWESVYYIQHEMTGGWLLRGIHHYTAQVMVILLALHMLQVIIDGAYRAPREVNFWLGLLLLNVVLALSLTGYLLPWDQKGYWSTKVATSVMNVVPVAGPYLQRLVVGGPTYGHHTLTRFFALHAGLLPFLMIVLTAAHVYVFRRHGLRYKEPRLRNDSYFWPDQVLRDAVACLAVLAVVLLLCLRFGLAGGGFHDAGKLGAELSAPADPTEPYGAARPEWYFLFLFQFLKLPQFAGEHEVVGAVFIPGGTMLLLFLMPVIGRWKAGHWFNVFVTVLLFTGAALLTTMALVEDTGRPHLAVPLLGRLGLGFSIAWLGLMLLGVLLLLPTIGREREFRHNIYVLGGLVAAVVVAVLVIAAGGGVKKPSAAEAQFEAGLQTAVPAPATVVVPGADADLSRAERIHRALLYGLLGGVALLITVVLLKSPTRTGARLRAGRAVTAAADAEARDAATAFDNASAFGNGGDGVGGVAPADHTSWLRRWELHHRARLALLLVVLGGTVLLLAVSVVGGSDKEDKRQAYRAAVASARRDAERVVAIAGGPTGIPPQGAVWLLRNDPATQGPRLFARNCASCHRVRGHDGTGAPVGDPQSAPDLYGFASRQWIAGLLDPAQVDSERYFGPKMKAHAGKMVQFVKEDVAEATEDAEKKDLQHITLALSAEAALPAQREADRADATQVATGREAMAASVFECTKCHAFRDEKPSLGGANRGPDLTGYGSRQWLIDFIRNPAHPRFYPGAKNDRMPAYGEQKMLDDHAIGMIADWLRGDVDGAIPTGEVAPAAAATTAPAATAPAAPVEDEPAATKPAETQPAQTRPAETKPAATAPVEPRAEMKTEEPKPTGKPAEPAPAPPRPADAKPPLETEFDPPAPAPKS